MKTQGKQRIEDETKKEVEHLLEKVESSARDAEWSPYVEYVVGAAKRIQDSAYQKYVQKRLNDIQDIYQNIGLPKKREQEIGSARSAARGGERGWMEIYLNNAKFVSKLMGIPLEESVEMEIRDIPMKEGREIIARRLESLELSARDGYQTYKEDESRRICGLLKMIGDPDFSEQIAKRLEEAERVYQTEGIAKDKQRRFGESMKSAIKMAVGLVRLYDSDKKFSIDSSLREEGYLKDNVNGLAKIAREEQMPLPQSFFDGILEIPEGNKNDARTSLAQLSKYIQGNRELEKYFEDALKSLEDKKPEAVQVPQRRSFFSRVFGGNGR